MAEDIENWPTSGMSCLTNTKDPKEIKRQKVEAILEHGSGDFLVGFIAYRDHFWLVCLKYQRVHFRAAVGALEKKIIFYFIGMFMSLFCCQSIVEASEKWN